jgi:serine/threonine protein kinase
MDRDLKLENILLETKDINGVIKVIDFGTSKLFKSKEKLHKLIGTVIILILV